MLKFVIALVFIMNAAIFADPSKADLRSQQKAMHRAYFRKEYKKFIKFMPDWLILGMGGKDKALKVVAKDPLGGIGKFIEVKILKISEIVEEVNCYAAFSEIRTYYDFMGDTVEQDSYDIAILDKNEDSWKFISSQNSEHQIQYIKEKFPNLLAKVGLPKHKINKTAAHHNQAISWKKYSFIEDKFSINFPFQPVLTTQEKKNKNSIIQFKYYLAKTSDRAYSVSVTKNKNDNIKSGRINFKEIRNNFLKRSIGSKLVLWKDTLENRILFKEYKIQINKKTLLFGRMCFINSILYNIGMESIINRNYNQDVEFLNSFSVLNGI